MSFHIISLLHSLPYTVIGTSQMSLKTISLLRFLIYILNLAQVIKSPNLVLTTFSNLIMRLTQVKCVYQIISLVHPLLCTTIGTDQKASKI